MGDEKSEALQSLADFHDRSENHVEEQDEHQGKAAGENDGDTADFVGKEEGVEIFLLRCVESVIYLPQCAKQGDQSHQDEYDRGQFVGREEPVNQKEEIVWGVFFLRCHLGISSFERRGRR